MPTRQPPPMEISKTTLGAVVAAIGGVFLLIAALSFSWWTGTAKNEFGNVQYGVGLGGLQTCVDRVESFFSDDAKGKKDSFCGRSPFGETPRRLKVPGAWAFFGRATFYSTLLTLGAILLALGVVIGGNRLDGPVTPARLAVVLSGVTLVLGVVFVILKPNLSRAVETPNMSLDAGFSMFMHIFGSLTAAAGAVLLVIDAPQLRQPEIELGYRPVGQPQLHAPQGPPFPAAQHAAQQAPSPVSTHAAANPVPSPAPPNDVHNLTDTLQSPPPAEAIIDQPGSGAEVLTEAATLAASAPEPAVAPEPPLPPHSHPRPQTPAPVVAPPLAFFAPPPPPPTPACKQCAGPTRYIETFRKAFCDRCEVYTRM